MLDEAPCAHPTDPHGGRGPGRLVPCLLIREGSQHEFWDVGGVRLSIPRHRDINQWTAEAIMRDLDEVLGEDWWRR